VLHVKGASELVLSSCTKYLVEEGKVLALDDYKRNEIKQTVINEFASNIVNYNCKKNR
jgi:hypothetical protein